MSQMQEVEVSAEHLLMGFKRLNSPSKNFNKCLEVGEHVFCFLLRVCERVLKQGSRSLSGGVSALDTHASQSKHRTDKT